MQKRDANQRSPREAGRAVSGARFERVPDVLFTAIGDDVVALNVERGNCYSMEQVTAALWNLLAEPRDLDDLCAQLEERFEVEHQRCRSDVARVIGEMVREGLLRELEPSP